MINEEQYLTKKEFASKANINIRTLTSLKATLKEENPNNRLVINKPKDRNDYFHKSLLKRYLSEENYQREENEYNYKRVIDCLMSDVKSYARMMFQYKWDYFGTIAYKKNFSSNVCYDLMSNLYEGLEQTFGNRAEIRIFFTTEPFSDREGHHTHFVLRVNNFKVREEVVNYIKSYFAQDKVELMEYDMYKAGVFYICKNGLRKTDWDIREKSN